MLINVTETSSVDDTHLFHPEGKKRFIMNPFFVTFCFGIGVHVGIKVIMELLFGNVGGGTKEERVLSPKGIFPVTEWLFTLGSTQDVTLESILPPLLEKTSVELRHEVVEDEGSNKSFVGTVPVFDPVVFNPHDDC